MSERANQTKSVYSLLTDSVCHRGANMFLNTSVSECARAIGAIIIPVITI